MSKTLPAATTTGTTTSAKTYTAYIVSSNGKKVNVRRGALTKNGDDTPVDVMNLKVDPVKAQDVLKIPGVYPAYHMNHKQWISVALDGTLTDGDVMELVGTSFDLTSNKKRNAK